MDPTSGIMMLIFLMVVLLGAVYWTLFKIRAELTDSQERIRAELSEIRKLLGSKTDKA